MKILEKNNIKFLDTYVPFLRKFISEREKNSMVFSVRIGYFETNISFLKVHKKSYNFNRYEKAVGTFANIYLHEMNGKKYIIKSQKMSSRDRAELNNSINDIFVEYIHFKIASIL